MKHASSRELFHYWTMLRGTRPAPAREEIDPTALRRVLGDSLILSFEQVTGPIIRLAGTRVCALFGREMKAARFLPLWAAESRSLMNSLINIVTAELSAVVAGAHGQALGEAPVPLELLLLPLLPSAGRHARLIGVLTPLAPVYWIGARPVETLRLGAFRHVDSEPLPPAIPAGEIVRAYPENPVRQPSLRRGRPRLVVHEGGAAARPARTDRPQSD